MADEVLVAEKQALEDAGAEHVESDDGSEAQLVETICDLLYGTDPQSHDLDVELTLRPVLDQVLERGSRARQEHRHT